MDDLPTEYDAIVVGTGMTESIIAAALSRVGKSVLHLDPNEYYGDNWASFNLEGFVNWGKTVQKTDKVDKSSSEHFKSLVNENESVINISRQSNLWNVCITDYSKKADNLKNCDEGDKGDESQVNTDDDIKVENTELPEVEEGIQKLSRRFNLDLCPKLLFSKGLMVQLLISSNIARYAEFKSVSRVLTWRENQLEPVPCSRADVFATKNVSVVQKRILVKILTLFANYTENLNEFQEFENKTFLSYLKHKKLPENLIHYILYAIAMGDNKTPLLEGVKACKSFLESLGRYGNTPFIFPMYGSGELPQCFCRLCAVFGGIYCLQRGIEGLIIKDNKCIGVISDGKRLTAKTVVLSSGCAPKEYLSQDNTEKISRGVFITDRSILTGDKESLTLLMFPPVPQVTNNSVTVIELGSGTCTCPENYFVVHMTTKMTKDASTDFKHVTDSLFSSEESETEESSKPRVLWSSTWNVDKGSSHNSEHCVENLKVCCSVDSELDYDFSINEAKRIFSEIYPDEEFLPRAPDPEEIVLDGEEKGSEDATTAENSDKSDTEKSVEKAENETVPVPTEAEKSDKRDIGEIIEKTENCDISSNEAICDQKTCSDHSPDTEASH